MRTPFPPALVRLCFLAFGFLVALPPASAPADELDAMMQQIDKQTRGGKSPEDQAASLQILMTTGTVEKRRAAMWEARIFVDSQPVIQTLTTTLQKGEPNLAAMAALVLGQMKIKAAGPPLEQALGHASPYVRESAAYGLALLRDPAYAPALRKARPEKPGLAQWIFDDALAALGAGPAPAELRRTRLRGAGVYYLGGDHTDRLRDAWKPLIEREALRVHSHVSADLNPQMGFLGGPIDAREFYAMLADQELPTEAAATNTATNPVAASTQASGFRPAIDVVLLCNLGPDEFPFELQWRLFQFMRRGGALVMLGDSFFSSGQINGQNGKVARVYSYIPEFWDTLLPHKLDKEFRPFRAGMREPGALTTAVGRVGAGTLIRMQGGSSHRDNTRGWDSAFLRLPNYGNILRYAIEGDAGFPALVDLRAAPAQAQSGQPLAFQLNLFSALGPTPANASPDTADRLEVDLIDAFTPSAPALASRSFPLTFASSPTLAFKGELPTDWRLPSGDYQLRFTLRRATATGSASTNVTLESPLKLACTLQDHYRSAGGELAGQFALRSSLEQPVENASAVVELQDPLGRVLQRWSRPLTIKPGSNEPIPFAFQARPYRTDSYPVTFRVEVGGRTVERASQFLARTGPAMFDQDLVLAPFGGLDPATDQRSKDVMLAAGFNGVGRVGGVRPGWYNWSYDVAPKARAAPVWPGDLIEQMKADRWGQEMRDRSPGWSVIDEWDEGSTKVLQADTGQYFSGAEVFYRNWLKAKYRSLDRLNAAWREHFKNAGDKNKPVLPKPWESDLSSWEQVQLGQGSPVDWNETGHLWWMMLYAERSEYQRTNRYHQLWHNGDIFHSRIYSSEPPGTLAWQAQESRGRLGKRPSSIMIHVINAEKGTDLYARFPWNAIVAGSRHMSVWSVGLAQTGSFGFNSGWTILDSDYTVKPWWKPAAASLARARSKDQVLLDAWNSLSPQVAFLYNGRGGTPRALFDALYFAGILPDAIMPGTLRGERMEVSGFKVIFRLGSDPLSPTWQARLDAWQKAGGLLVEPPELKIEGYGGKKVDAEEGIQVWVGSDQARLASAAFAQYQMKVLALLESKGVRPVAALFDDAGLPAPAVESVLLETHDQTQRYLLAVPDADIFASQALGTLAPGAPAQAPMPTAGPGRIDLPDTLYDAAGFTLPKPGTYRVWLQFESDKPFDTRVTVDGQPPLPFRTFEKLDWFRVERGLGRPRWVAGPAFRLAEGVHKLRVESRDASRPIKDAMLLDQPMIEPTLRPAPDAGVKSAVSVYDEAPLQRTADGGYRLPLRQSQGELVALLTEELAAPKMEARLVRSPTDRVLQVRIELTQKDGSPSHCRHSVALEVFDTHGKPVPGLTAKTSVLGWRVASLFPGHDDPPAPWTIRLKDLTTGQSAQTVVAADAPAASPWDRDEAGPPVEMRTDDVTMYLNGQVHFVPLRVTVTNNRDAAIEGTLALALPAELLLEGELTKPVRVEGHKSATFTWPVVLGRDKAKPIGMMESPPRCTLTLKDGQTLGLNLDTFWVRQMEKQPPLLTDLAEGRVEARLLNFLDRPVNARLGFALPATWRVTEAGAEAVVLPAAKGNEPGLATVAFKAGMLPEADQPPAVISLPMSLRVGERAFDVGGMLVEAQKLRTWFVARTTEMEGSGSTGAEPKIPKTAVNAKSARLMGLDWQPFQADTMIDFPSEFGRTTLGVTNVRFAQAGKVSVRVRGRERVDVWLAGRALTVGTPYRDKPDDKKESDKRTARADAIAELETMGESAIEVPAGEWLPLMVRYRRESAEPLTDLVFLDAQGKAINSATCRAEPGQ